MKCLKTAIKNTVQKRVCEFTAFWLEGEKTSDIYLSNAEKKKMFIAIACAGREAFMICLSYYSDFSLLCLFSLLLIALVSTEANRFSNCKTREKSFPRGFVS